MKPDYVLGQRTTVPGTLRKRVKSLTAEKSHTLIFQ